MHLASYLGPHSKWKVVYSTPDFTISDLPCSGSRTISIALGEIRNKSLSLGNLQAVVLLCIISLYTEG